jgi:hypothetical protein
MLDLSVPYERAVALELLNIGECDDSVEFNKFEYCEPGAGAGGGGGGGGAFTPLKLVRLVREVPQVPPEEAKELVILHSMKALSRFTWDEIHAIARKHYSLDPDVLVKADIDAVLKELQLLDVPLIVQEVLFTLDPFLLGKYFFLCSTYTSTTQHNCLLFIYCFSSFSNWFIMPAIFAFYLFTCCCYCYAVRRLGGDG